MAKISLRAKAWIIAFVLAGLGFAGFSLLTLYQNSIIRGLEEDIEGLKMDRIVMRCRVMDRDGQGFRVKMAFYDVQGEKVGERIESLSGQGPFFDFVSVPVAKTYIAFPFSVFTERMPPSQGIVLCKSYDKDGFPMIFRKNGQSQKAIRDLRRLFSQIKQGRLPKGSFGNAVHQLSHVQDFKTGHTYKIIYRSQGGIEIIEDQGE